MSPRPSPPAVSDDDWTAHPDPLDTEAATWVLRVRAGLDMDGRAQLDAWLAQGPAHRAAFDGMQALLGELRTLPLHGARPAVPPVLPPASPGRRAWLRGPGRWAPAALALAAVGGGGLAWTEWRRQPTFAQDYASARGQQLQLDLPDGSHLRLDTTTRAEVRLYRDRREVHLLEGQGFFEVQADADRPFHVRAGSARVTVVGTRFAVRHTHSGLDAGATRVAVDEGRVRVARATEAGRANGADGAGDAGVMLAAGQTVVLDTAGLGPVVAMAAGSAAPWRDGRLSFENTPLAQALAEFERYGATGVVTGNAAVAALRVGGSYSLRNFAGFVQALPRQLPVRLETRDGVTVIVAAS
ncbi:MAG: Protein FecR [Paracidovorax wautersii]|uniref:Protein FecR n=1 Tax=Paracidovorax wautersii TaxID=1177982 RepID=A0A7V8FQQ4_9BURK|nr:MAG: Protein FecR [Paracidovorax wautersii]